MIKKIIKYLFEPFECRYESNWSEQCYNRFWDYCCLTILNPILFIPVFLYFDLYTKNCFMSIISFVIFILFFIINIVQLLVMEIIYKDKCQELSDIINGRKSQVSK